MRYARGPDNFALFHYAYVYVRRCSSGAWIVSEVEKAESVPKIDDFITIGIRVIATQMQLV